MFCLLCTEWRRSHGFAPVGTPPGLRIFLFSPSDVSCPFPLWAAAIDPFEQSLQTFFTLGFAQVVAVLVPDELALGLLEEGDVAGQDAAAELLQHVQAVEL